MKRKYGIVNTKSLYVRSGAGKEYNSLTAMPVIEQNQKVEILNIITEKDGEKWYWVRIKNNIYGYVKAQFITLL